MQIKDYSSSVFIVFIILVHCYLPNRQKLNYSSTNEYNILMFSNTTFDGFVLYVICKCVIFCFVDLDSPY